MSLRRPEAPPRKLPCDRQNAIWDLTINNQSTNALQNQFSRILFQQDGADREIIEHDHTAPNQGALKFLGAAGREDIVIDYQTGAITIGAAGNLTLNLPIVSNPDDFQVGTTFSTAGDQVWWKATDAIVRVGSSTAAGDATDVDALGFRTYGENAAGDPMGANDYAVASVTPNQITLTDVDAATSVTVLRATPTVLAYTPVAATGEEFRVTTADVFVGTGNGAEIVTVRLRNFANLNFANDAAAAAGGIVTGGVYHTAGALRVRIV